MGSDQNSKVTGQHSRKYGSVFPVVPSVITVTQSSFYLFTAFNQFFSLGNCFPK